MHEVVLLHDQGTFVPTVEAALGAFFATATRTLGDALDDDAPSPTNVAVFCLARLGAREAVQISDLVQRHGWVPLFVFPSYRLEQIERAQTIGARACLVPPFNGPALVAGVRKALNEGVETTWSNLHVKEETALRSALVSFDDMLAAAGKGAPLPLETINAACADIQASLGVSNVDRWLGALQKHHNNTYKHSMFVCGVLAFFASSLGIKGDDLKEVTVGGFLHDAGKAMIPLAILDKPSKLDDDEWQVMRTHPEHSRTILLREHGLSQRVVRMAVHHHEKLDGTGYPDRLDGKQLDDTVRLTAIADVYAALAEARAYKPAMPPEKALEIMSGFQGHLDMDLLRAFRAYILDQPKADADAVAA